MKRVPGIAALGISACLLMGAADGSWLKRVPAADKARVSPLSDQKMAAEAGSHLYAEACAKCHGQQAQGKGNRPALISDRVKSTTDGDLAWLLKNGNSWKGMPSWSSMPDAERWQLVAYVRSLNATPTASSTDAQHGEGASQ